MLRRGFALLLLLASIGSASQVVIRLPAEAEVTGEQILLGQIGEIQGEEELVSALARTPVGVAPQPGDSRLINLNADIAPRLRKAGYRPEDFVWEGSRTVKILAQADEQKVNRVKTELEAQLLANPHGQDYRWQVEILPETIPSWVKGEVKLNFAAKELPAGKINLRVQSQTPPLSFSCQAEVRAWGTPLVTARELAAGSLLESDAVSRGKEMELTSYLTAGSLPVLQLAADLHLKRSLPAASVLTWSDVEYPLLVQKDKPVLIVIRQGAVQVQAAGRALTDGRLGERISIVNISSERVIEGVVTGQGLVEVGR